MESILIVDDELPIRELLKYNLEKEGFTIYQAETGTQALEIARKKMPDLIILDLMLPDMSGLDICRIIKNDKPIAHIPIIMLTAKTEDSDIVGGLELGADDYITKPFSPKVLVARIQAVLRREEIKSDSKKLLPDDEKKQKSSIIKLQKLSINPEKFEVHVNDKLINFSATEFAILTLLASHPGHVFSRQKIINSIKGESYPVTERSIDVQILSIRKKLGKKAKILETVRGVGYKINEKS